MIAWRTVRSGLSKRHTSFLAIALWLSAVAAYAQQPDEFINAELLRQRIPGLSLVVLKNGQIITAKGYGLADVKQKTPVTPETVFKIGSVSKQFIATGIMLLVQEGRLGLDDPLSKFLDDAPPAWSPITIRHLLTHTSGLAREGPGFDPFKVQSDADVIRSAYSMALRFSAGEKWEYSNLGYFALAEVIRKVGGHPWSEYLRDQVFLPAGMHSTRTTTLRDSVPGHAQGYSDNDKWDEADDWPAVRPSGAFVSTVLDLAKWEAKLQNGAILSDSTRRLMWTPVTLNRGASHPYGFGWQLAPALSRRAVHHGGGIPGFRAYYARFIDDGLTIIVLMNLDDVDPITIVNGVARFYLPEPGRDSQR